MQQTSCKERKKYVTLIEVMIVMFLIALIAGVVAYNYRGSLDEGRAFQTKQNIEKIRNILELELAKERNPNYTTLENDWKTKYIDKSPIVKDSKALVKDGWGNDLKIKVTGESFTLYSDSAYCKQAGNAEKCGQPENVSP